MLTRRVNLAAVVVVALNLAALGACHDAGRPASETAPLQTDIRWQLVSFEPDGAPATAVPDPTLYRVRFGSDGTVAIRADCNRCGGRYRVAGASMTIDPLACTLAACPLQSLGSRYTAALTGVKSYVQAQSELLLVSDGETLRFRLPD